MLIKIFKKNIIEIIFVLMLSLCFFRFKVLASLHLVGFLFSFFVFLLASLQSRFGMSYKTVCWLVGILVLGIFSYIISGNPSNLSISYFLMNYSLPVLYVLITDSTVRNLSYFKILSIIKKMLGYVRIYLFVELITRLFIISAKYIFARDFLGLYINLKQTSFSYSDCNFLGLFILWLYCLSLYLYKTTNDKFFKKQNHFLVFFAFTSMSRSVMLTIIAINYLVFLYKKYKGGHFVFLVANVLVIPLLIFFIYNVLMNDASFRSKVGILQGLRRIYGYSMNNILFGFGYGVGEYAYSYIKDGFGHLHIALFLGQIGVIGITYFLFWLMRINSVAKNNCLLIIFAFLLSGFSLSFADSSFFLCMAIIADLERKRKESNLALETQLLI